MAETFLSPARLVISTLSPIHVGNGEDLEPTEYIIRTHDVAGVRLPVLIEFDPTQAMLTDSQRRELRTLVSKAETPSGLLRLRRFFLDNADQFTGHARRLLPCRDGVARDYHHKLADAAQQEVDKKVINQLAVHRHAYIPGSNALYLPGSSLKGAIRTAWLNELIRNHKANPRYDAKNALNMEKDLLGGGFQKDPFRSLKIGDSTDLSHPPAAEICYAVNHKKRAVCKDGKLIQPRGVATQREVMAGGQARVLCSSAVLHLLGDGRQSTKDLPERQQRITQWQAIAQACNAYYQPRLDATLALFDERRFAEDWVKHTRHLLAHLQPALAAGRAFVLRVGRHSGAECVTLDGVRSIKIMQGQGQPAKYEPSTHTIWLAGDTATARSGPPFGWLLIEIDPTAPLPVWPWTTPPADLSGVRDELLAHRAAQEQQRAQKMQAAAEQQQAAAAEQRRQAEAAARLAALSPHQRQQAEWRTQLAAVAGLRPISDSLWQTVGAWLKTAEGWPLAERAELAQWLLAELPRHFDVKGKNPWKERKHQLEGWQKAAAC